MNYRNILKVYKLERELAPDDLALLNTLRGMTDAERELLAESLGLPAKVKAKPATKKFKKCDVCGVSKKAARHRDTTLPDYHEFDEGGKQPGKSIRASSLQQTLTGTVTNRKPALCTYELDGKVCKGAATDAIHDEAMGYGGYHPFVSSAQPAPDQLSTMSAVANSGTATEDVSVAVGG